MWLKNNGLLYYQNFYKGYATFIEDLNGDAIKDILVAGILENNSLEVCILNTANGAPINCYNGEPTNYANDRVYVNVIDDVNNNGYKDIVITRISYNRSGQANISFIVWVPFTNTVQKGNYTNLTLAFLLSKYIRFGEIYRGGILNFVVYGLNEKDSEVINGSYVIRFNVFSGDLYVEFKPNKLYTVYTDELYQDFDCDGFEDLVRNYSIIGMVDLEENMEYIEIHSGNKLLFNTSFYGTIDNITSKVGLVKHEDNMVIWIVKRYYRGDADHAVFYVMSYNVNGSLINSVSFDTVIHHGGTYFRFVNAGELLFMAYKVEGQDMVPRVYFAVYDLFTGEFLYKDQLVFSYDYSTVVAYPPSYLIAIGDVNGDGYRDVLCIAYEEIYVVEGTWFFTKYSVDGFDTPYLIKRPHHSVIKVNNTVIILTHGIYNKYLCVEAYKLETHKPASNIQALNTVITKTNIDNPLVQIPVATLSILIILVISSIIIALTIISLAKKTM